MTKHFIREISCHSWLKNREYLPKRKENLGNWEGISVGAPTGMV
jgi:hypothetical protein